MDKEPVAPIIPVTDDEKLPVVGVAGGMMWIAVLGLAITMLFIYFIS